MDQPGYLKKKSKWSKNFEDNKFACHVFLTKLFQQKLIKIHFLRKNYFFVSKSVGKV
jgi:hypothetical protein